MEKKELFKELIITAQQNFNFDLISRDVRLPINTGKIIVACGVRRSGKSSVLQLAINQILENGVPADKILYMNFDDERLSVSVNELDYILQAYREIFPLTPMSDVYIFWDEIQLITGWESFVRRVYDSETKNIFITGSNSKMLSTEIASTLRGRSMQFEIYPLSFIEYCRFKKQGTNYYHNVIRAQVSSLFAEFQLSAFPELCHISKEYYQKVLQEYFYVMLYRDLIEHYQISNLPALKYLIRRLMANISKPTSINKIHNELKSSGISVGKNSLYEWVEYLQSIYFFLPLHKYEPSLVRELASDRKFYCIDTGLRHTLIHAEFADRAVLLENQVYIWLRSQIDQSTQLFYHKADKECDFVVVHQGITMHLIQVCWQLEDENTLQREIDGLLEASGKLDCDNLMIITADTEKTFNIQTKVISVIPAWKVMLEGIAIHK